MSKRKPNLKMYEELDKTQDVYFLVSGGRDNTAMVLLAYEQGIKGTLFFGDTTLNLGTARKTLDRLQTYTGYPLIIVKYDGEEKPNEVLSRSFSKIPDCVRHLKETGVFRRNMFDCCKILKHDPMLKKERELGKNTVFLLGLKTEMPIHRLGRMNELRKWGTFYRLHSNGILFYYPLRDVTEDTDIDDVLKRHGFQNTKSSGCITCPIFCVFENWRKKDGTSWRLSIRKADRLGIDHPAKGQQFFSSCGESLE